MTEIKTISFIGAGNLAWHLATHLKKKNFKIVTIYSRTLNSAKKLATAVNAEATNNLSRMHNSDLNIISIPDDAIINIAELICLKKGIVVHTAGSLSINTIKNIASSYGVIYPLQTFSKERDIDMSSIPICIEGNNATTTKLLENVAKKISNKVYNINSTKRKSLHVAAVFACNFTNYMYQKSEEILKKEAVSYKLLAPLILETAKKSIDLSPSKAQTGPAFRNDIKTLKKHLDFLIDFPELKKIYNFITQDIQNNKKDIS